MCSANTARCNAINQHIAGKKFLAALIFPILLLEKRTLPKKKIWKESECSSPVFEASQQWHMQWQISSSLDRKNRKLELFSFGLFYLARW